MIIGKLPLPAESFAPEPSAFLIFSIVCVLAGFGLICACVEGTCCIIEISYPFHVVHTVANCPFQASQFPPHPPRKAQGM